MKILIFHQYYLNKGEPGISRFNQFTKYWVATGHQITVIAGSIHNQFLTKHQKQKHKLITVEQKNPKIKIIRGYVSPLYNVNFRGRLWAYLTYTFSSTIAGLISGKQDIIIATSPPLHVAVPGYIISRLKKIPLVFEVRDLWPKFAIDTGVLKNKLLIKLALWLEKWIYRKANLINVLTPAFKKYLISEKNVPEKKIIYIPNAADLDLMEPGPKNNWVREKYNWKNKFVILYVGAHGIANDLWQIIDVAKILKDNKNILFALVGDGMEKLKLKTESQKQNLKNIQFINPVPKEKIIDFINASNLCTAVLKPYFTTTYPNKVFDYMSCSKPIVLLIDGACRKLVVDEAQAGFFVKPNDAKDFRDKILYFYNHSDETKKLGENGYNFVRKNFNREKLAKKYLMILSKLVKE